MDISRMIKRATGNIKYLAITAILSLNVLIGVMSLVLGMSGPIVSSPVMLLASAVANICLIVYALNSHGGKGVKISGMAYFGIMALSRLTTYILPTMGGIDMKSLFGFVYIIAYLILAAFLFIGVRGVLVYIPTAALVFMSAFSLFEAFEWYGGFFGLIPTLSLVLPIVANVIAGYLVATDKK